jgi:hypothetical protein
MDPVIDANIDFQSAMADAFPSARKASPMPQMAATLGQPRASDADFIVYLVLLIIGVPLYLGGARYTYDGIPTTFNFVMDWLRLPVSLSSQPIPDSLWGLRLGAIIVVGWLFSRIETRPPTIKSLRARYKRVTAQTIIVAILVFVVCFAADAGSTYFGVIKPPAPDAWPITRWIATNMTAAWAWSIFLTVVPDWMIVIGWRGMISSAKKKIAEMQTRRPRR